MPRLITNKDSGAESSPYCCGFTVRPHFRASSIQITDGAPLGDVTSCSSASKHSLDAEQKSRNSLGRRHTCCIQTRSNLER
jgi:hypothetical protein